ncbi:MAG: hypothetical protein QMD85_00760 [Candidatus Aenigmarchaeota archaeon]|nr:hypothetical protein [Candidatus Aenigmarchaeota archaeon]MDI6722068.1 hypothetical protein [Candidatus Aenigmarchaeota archaeon]
MSVIKYFFLVIILLSGVAFAQGVDTVIITTDKASVDLLVAKAAGDRNGMPVFTAPNGELNDELKSSLAGMKNIIIIGGPLAVSMEAENALKPSYNVIRLWGIVQTGTAVEVAKHFWITGSKCAVLAEDTKNPETDTQGAIIASTLGSNLECPFIPVPKGEMPTDVLALLENMNTTDVFYAGKENKGALAKYKLIELKDADDEVADYYSNNTKVVIVAAKHWKDITAIAPHPGNGAIVKFVTNASHLPPVIKFITDNDIKDVRIVGVPSIAQEIDSALRKEGITPTKVVGEKSSEVAKKIWEDHKEKWKEKREKYVQKRNDIKDKIKIKLLERLNETESEIDEESIEIDDLAANGNVSLIRLKLQEARAKLSSIKQDIMAGDVEIAQRKLQEIRDYRKEKWQSRDKIKWDWQAHIDLEERGVANLRGLYESTLNQVNKMLPNLKEKCNSTDIEKIAEEAKALQNSTSAALDAKNYSQAALILSRQRELVHNAKKLANICERDRKLPEIAKHVAERNTERAMKLRKGMERKTEIAGEIIKDRMEGRMNETGRQAETVTGIKNFTIEGDDISLSPDKIEVIKGDKVKIMFKVRNERVSFGGLDFRSDYFTTNKISPGSTGEAEFTADKSFTFISYWPGTNVEKARGQVVVKRR